MKKFLQICMSFLLLFPTIAIAQSIDQTHINYFNPMLASTECNSAALTASIASIATAERTLFLTATNRAKAPCTWQLTVNQTIPENILLYVPHGVKANIPPGITLTIAGCLRSDDSDWFSGGGNVNQTGTCAAAPLAAQSTLVSSYAISGCTHITSPTTTVNIASCVAMIKTTTTGSGTLIDLSNQSISYTGGDGRYWLLVRSDLTVTPVGWTCIAGTNYCYLKQDNIPAVPLGTMLIQRSTVASGLITLVRRVLPTNGVNPGHIYLTDPYIAMLCDGRTDESQKMQLAVALSSERGGTTLEAPAGTCLMKNVEITQYNEDPGGVDNNDLRHGCTSVRGQGPGQTTFMAPNTIAPEEHILMSNCTAFGAGQQEPPGFIAAGHPSGTVIEHLQFSGRRTRVPEHHGLIMQGTYARLNNVNFHWINGTALWVGKTTKLESGWINNVQVRGSGRYVDDCGCQSGTATRNAPAVLFGKPTDEHRNNNIYAFGLQVVYSWYSGLSIDCTDGLNINLYFYGAMMHNHEAVDTGEFANQGRLDSDNGALTAVRGTCHNIVLDGFNFVAPGSDAPDTNNITAPAVPALRIDAMGAAGKPGEIILSNSYFNASTAGKGIYIKESGRFIMNNVNFRADSWSRGQIEVVPGAFTTSDPNIQVYNKFFLCNVATLTADKVSMAYADVSAISDCNSKTHSYRMASDSEMVAVETGNWTMPAADTVLAVPHGVSCPVVGTMQVAHITIGLVANPGANCTQRWITACCASTFTLNCNTAPGGAGLTGTYAIHVPNDCTTTQGRLYEMTAQNVTGIFTAYTPVFLHEMFYTSFNPGSTGTATDYAEVIINKRKLASIVPVAKVSNQNTTYSAWTPVKFTVLDYNELLVNVGESIVVTTDKFGTTGVALNKALITVNSSPFPAIKP